MTRRQLAFLVLGVASVSVSSILIRLADAPALSVAFYRNAIAAAILLPLALVRHGDELRGLTRRQWGVASLAGALLAAHFATWIPSVDLISVAASTVLVTTQPIWVAIGERILGHRVARGVGAGIALSVAGAVVIFAPDLGSTSLAGDVLALAGAVTAAGYLLAGRSLRREVSLLVYVGVAYTVAAAVLAVVVVAAGEPFTGFAPSVWLLFLLMALIPQIGGHTVFNYLLADVPPTVIGVAVTAEPVGATILAFVVLGEVPSWTAVVGGAIVLAGIALTVRAQAAPVEAPVE